jgi:hypothetical protein
MIEYRLKPDHCTYSRSKRHSLMSTSNTYFIFLKVTRTWLATFPSRCNLRIKETRTDSPNSYNIRALIMVPQTFCGTISASGIANLSNSGVSPRRQTATSGSILRNTY